MVKIISWNVNGIRAWSKKDCLPSRNTIDWTIEQSPDVFCVQETKAEIEQLLPEVANIGGYFSFFSSSKERKGHSGVAVYTKRQPDKVTYGLGIKELDQQGRQVNLFYGDVVIINCYFPNGGGPHERFLFKLKYYDYFLKFINKLKRAGKTVVFCGDVNVAHAEIDLARPESNKKSVGFLPEERAWLDEVIKNGYIDTFRALHSTDVKYSWWDMKTRARDRGVGWRIDYFFVDKKLKSKLKNSEIHDEVLGSDHAPIELNFS